MSPADPVERWRSARRDSTLAVLEGFHPLKHALRFRAEILEAVSPDPAALLDLADALAPDVRPPISARLKAVDRAVFERLAPRPPATGVMAIARRPEVDPAAVLAGPASEPIVFLDRPRRMGNIGAAVRVAAGAGAAAVLTSGPHDPWNPAAIRGAAGLHWAVPVARVDELPRVERPLVAVDPDGEPLGAEALPPGAVLAFGTERHGLADAILRRSDRRVSIPMRPGVSSLNLATAVAVVLYAWRLAPPLERGVAEDDIPRDNR